MSKAHSIIKLLTFGALGSAAYLQAGSDPESANRLTIMLTSLLGTLSGEVGGGILDRALFDKEAKTHASAIADVMGEAFGKALTDTLQRRDDPGSEQMEAIIRRFGEKWRELIAMAEPEIAKTDGVGLLAQLRGQRLLEAWELEGLIAEIASDGGAEPYLTDDSIRGISEEVYKRLPAAFLDEMTDEKSGKPFRKTLIEAISELLNNSDEVLSVINRLDEKVIRIERKIETAVVQASTVDEMTRTTRAILERQTEQSEGIAEIKSAVVAPSLEAVSRVAFQTIQVAADASAVTQEYNAQLDHAKELIDKFQPKEALEFVSQLEKRIPSDVGRLVRYRLLTNKAIAKAAIGEARDAGVLFIEAHQYNPDDEKALCNRGVGHFLLGESDEAITFVNQVLKRNPASARAYEVLTYCAPPDAPLDQVIERIPRALRETEGIACALAHQALERGDLPASIHWWEVAIKKSDKTRPDFLANLAGTLIESLTGKFEVVSGRQVSPEDKANIERAITLLTEAITAVAHTETIKFRVSWLVNRSAAYVFLGRIDEALADIDSALRIDPQDAGSLKQKAALLSRLNEFEKAIETLNGAAANPDVPEAVLLRAVILSETGKDKEAIRIVEDSLSTESIPAKLRTEENHLLLDIYIRRKEYENARRISSALRSADPTDILTLVRAARIEKAAGDTTTASRLLDEALTYVSETTPSRYLFELSDELYASERYVDAWPILEKVADIRLDNAVTHRLLYSYYRSGEFDKALAACKAVPAKKRSRFATQIEIAILEDIDYLPSAAAVCEEYLALYPDDLPMHVRRLVTLYRLGQFEQVDAFLNSPIDIQKLNLEAGLQLAGIYAERGMSRRSLEVAYELRRTYYNEGKAHLRYMGLFFSREKDLDAWLAGDRVAEDMAVAIRDNAGVQKWYVIEDRSDASAARGELNVADPLATKLLGKIVNDEIILSESAISQTKATIIEIKSKYVYALHDSLEVFPVRFAQVPGMERLMMRLDEGEEESQEGLKSFLESISQRDKRVREVEKLYLEGRITISTFANLIGKNVIDIWSGLVGDQRSGIRCCMGTPAEREQAVSLIKNNPRIAIDITALLTCRGIQTLDLLRKVFSEILISQSIIDLIQEAISERRSLSSKGFMTVWKEDEVYYRREVTAEDITQEIKRLEELREWVRSNCTTVPRRAAPKLGDQRRSQLTEVIGEAFLDTILIALDQRCPMYSDDLATRGFATSEFGVEGFWTQALALHALGTDQVDENEYNRLAIQLAVLNFRHTSINGSALIAAARQSEWVNKYPFSVVLNTLADSQTELRSVVMVASEFIFLLWRQLIPDFQRDALIMAVLDALTQKRKKDIVLGALEAAIKVRFLLLPLAETRVRQVMTVWRSLKL